MHACTHIHIHSDRDKRQLEVTSALDICIKTSIGILPFEIELCIICLQLYIAIPVDISRIYSTDNLKFDLSLKLSAAEYRVRYKLFASIVSYVEESLILFKFSFFAVSEIYSKNASVCMSTLAGQLTLQFCFNNLTVLPQPGSVPAGCVPDPVYIWPCFVH